MKPIRLCRETRLVCSIILTSGREKRNVPEMNRSDDKVNRKGLERMFELWVFWRPPITPAGEVIFNLIWLLPLRIRRGGDSQG